jgi:hypothetical protein
MDCMSRLDTGGERQHSVVPLRVFLCHSSEDKAAVRDLYHRLESSGVKPWLDESDLLPGQDWDREIASAVRNTDVALICLSKNSVSKAGYIQREIRYTLDIADQQPGGTIFLIPLRLESCDVPERLPDGAHQQLEVAVILLALGIAKNINLLTFLGIVLLVLLLLSAFVVGRRLHRRPASTDGEDLVLEPAPDRSAVPDSVRRSSCSSRSSISILSEKAGRVEGLSDLAVELVRLA